VSVSDLSVGSELLGYRVEGLLGRGGMSVVYLAEDLRLRRRVALKLLAPQLVEDPGFRERFLAESELAASLDHPCVVPIYEAGEADGRLFIAMRYVEGSDLKGLLRDGPLAAERTVRVCAQVADALDFAHERGLVHRDVKPSNVLLDARDHVYLADFGLTKRLAEPSVVEPGLFGTIDYVAPCWRTSRMVMAPTPKVVMRGSERRNEIWGLGGRLVAAFGSSVVGVGRPRPSALIRSAARGARWLCREVRSSWRSAAGCREGGWEGSSRIDRPDFRRGILAA
jgi:predicted Ser/Thr protein kinase